MARPLGSKPHLRGAKHGRANRRCRRSRRSRETFHPRHVSLSVGGWSACRSPTRLHRHRRFWSLQTNDWQKCFALNWIRLVWFASRATRNRHGHSSTHQYRVEHRQHASTVATTWSCPRSTTKCQHDRRKLLSLDAMDFSSDFQFVV